VPQCLVAADAGALTAGRNHVYIVLSHKSGFDRSFSSQTLDARGVYRGGSGRNLRPVWLKGEEFHPQGGRIPQIYGSY